ncbi:M48 family metalloprotease [Sinomonas flava]|uniref:M48 family metalloprotease n=1 Tax=Sinomonas flava TaxID=496857 RepID=UPI0039A5BD9A
MAEAGDGPPRARVNVLAYPAPSTGLFLLLIVALLSVGTFAGSWLFNLAQGREWVLATEACSTAASTATAGAPDAARAYQDAFDSCTAPLEQRRGMWSLGGALAMGAGATALVFAVPPILMRRRRLRPLPSAAGIVATRAAQAAAEAGLGHAPRLLAGTTGMADAFTFGTPGRYRVALPLKLIGLLAHPGPADGVLRHEYAHVAHHDVELTWLARSAWFVVAPVLALPIVGALVTGDASLVASYLWRAAIVAGVVELITDRNLRAREFDADLRAASGNAALLGQTLSLVPSPPPRSILLRLVSRHPDPARRRAVLAAPHLAAGTAVMDALIAGFLAALASPLLVQAGTAAFAGTDTPFRGQWTAAIVVGPILGATVGFGMWRAELVAAAADDAGWPRPAATSPAAGACGLAAGLALGSLVSLGQLGAPLGGLGEWWSLVAPVLCSAGAALLIAGLAALTAPLARTVRSPRPVNAVGMVTAVAVFTVGSWAWSTLQLSLAFGGVELALLWLATGYDGWPVLVAAAWTVGLAVLGIAFRRGASRVQAPAWFHFPEPAVPAFPAVAPRARSLPAALGVGGGVGTVAGVVQAFEYAAQAPVTSGGGAFVAQSLAVLMAAAACALATLVLGAAGRRVLFGAVPAAGALAAALSLLGFAAARIADTGGLRGLPAADLVALSAGAGFVACLAASGGVATAEAALAVVRHVARQRPKVPGPAEVGPAGATGLAR